MVEKEGSRIGQPSEEILEKGVTRLSEVSRTQLFVVDR